MRLTDRSAVRELMDRYGLSFDRQLGQNFLVNPSVCPRMAAMCRAGEADGVLEIGPGLGVLTTELAAVAKKVVALELDSRLKEPLAETLGGLDNVEVMFGDVMKEDLGRIIREHIGGRCVVCANLPYYITSPIIMRLLEGGFDIAAITVMVQDEAARRLAARPGERECGAISAAVWYKSVPVRLFSVSAGSFMPAPKVDSAVIRLDVRETPPVQADEKRMFMLVKAAFSQRRKRAVNAVSAGLGLKKEEVEAAFERAGLDPNIRAERITLEQFAALTDTLNMA